MKDRESRMALTLALLLGGIGTLLRLPLQLPLVIWALRVRDRA